MKPHIFSGWDYCMSCGISRIEMIQTQAMDSCPGDKDGRYIDARVVLRYVDAKTVYKKRHPEEGELIDEMLSGEPITQEINYGSKKPEPIWGHSILDNSPDVNIPLEAFLDIRTMEVHVVDRGIWVDLESYIRHQVYLRDRDKPRVQELFVDESHKKHVELHGKFLAEHIAITDAHFGNDMAPQDSQKFYERIGDLGVKKDTEPEEELKNYCKAGNGLAKCGCIIEKIDRKRCRFHKPASNEPRCMFLKFDEYCDSHLAQMEPYLSVKSS